MRHLKLFLICLLLACCSEGRHFDSTEWKSADLSGRARAEMLPDFLTRYALKGMSKGEIVALLGDPTPTDKWQGTDMIYVLGNDGSYMPIDHEWLLIQLDEQQKVISYERVTD